MVPASIRVPVPSGYVFPHGALALGVEPVTDFSRRDEQDNQARDKDTGQLLWTVSVIDLDPAAVRFGREKTKVKIAAPHRPVLPTPTVPGYPPAVEFIDLQLVPWVDDSRCHNSPDCRARLAWSLRASGISEAAVVVDYRQHPSQEYATA
jgi:hypothetical protein